MKCSFFQLLSYLEYNIPPTILGFSYILLLSVSKTFQTDLALYFSLFLFILIDICLKYDKKISVTFYSHISLFFSGGFSYKNRGQKTCTLGLLFKNILQLLKILNSTLGFKNSSTNMPFYKQNFRKIMNLGIYTIPKTFLHYFKSLKV